MQAELMDPYRAVVALLADVRAYGRLVFGGAASLGGLPLVSAGLPVAFRRSAESQHMMPVALIEPVRTARLWGRESNGPYDVRTGIAVKLGFDLLGNPVSPIPSAKRWTLSVGPRSGVLTDPTGEVLSRFSVNDDPSWRKRSEAVGEVTVIYGNEIGVRAPANISANSYGDDMRAQELFASRRAGTVSWGIVRFNP
jgi:hypothetical protein